MSVQPVVLQRCDTPIGRIEVVGDGEAITQVSIETGGALPHDHLPEHPDEVTEIAVAQLGEYFTGTRREFRVPVKLAGTFFQREVWAQLSRLAWGEVASYANLGHRIGKPAASRAVGGAVGANPVPIILPCHRVLGSSRQITGYSGGAGISTKAWLLRHEGISYRVPTCSSK